MISQEEKRSSPDPGEVLTWLLWSSLIVPVVLFGVSSVLLTVSVLRNLEYVEGRCQIEQLPESFETQRGAVTQVRGVKRGTDGQTTEDASKSRGCRTPSRNMASYC